jgi:hypothetical protein
MRGLFRTQHKRQARSIVPETHNPGGLEVIEGLPRFPCNLDKRPLTARGHLDATSSPIDESRWPLTGVPTGTASGLDVLDVDTAGWLDEHYSRLPATRVHETRSGGRHLLFRHAQGLRCSASRVAPGVDVRADGGYVIWWPRAGLRVLSDAPIADWPGWLLQLARPPSGAPGPFQIIAPNGLRAPGGGVSPTRNLRKRTKHILRLVERAEEGTRNNRLFWAACRFGEMVAEGVIRETVAVQLLESAATLCGLVADDGMSRIRATIASGLSVGARALETLR